MKTKHLTSILLVSICAYATQADGLKNTDYSLEMRKMPGEHLPVLNTPSLVKNWKFEQELKDWTPSKNNIAETVMINGQKALKLINRDNKRISVILSRKMRVIPGKKYLFSYVYHTESAKFGSFTKCMPIESNVDHFFAPRRYAYLGGYKTINRRPGEWQRFAKIYVPKTNFVRIALTLSGAPAKVIFDDIYFALNVPDSRKNPSAGKNIYPIWLRHSRRKRSMPYCEKDQMRQLK